MILLNFFLICIGLGFISAVILSNQPKPQTFSLVVTVQPALNPLPVREPESISDVDLPYFLEAPYATPSVN